MAALAKIENFCLLCFCSACVSQYSFFTETDFKTKYVHRNENGEAKICSFTGSERCVWVRNWAGCQGLYPFICLPGRYFCPGGWFVRLFRLFEHCFLQGRHICFENFSLGLRSKFLRNQKSGASAALATDKQTMILRPASFFYSGNRSKMAALNSSGYKHGFCTFFIKSLTYWRQFQHNSFNYSQKKCFFP